MHRKNGTDNAFYFKQFHIHHDRCAMKVGTDGVLLGAWVTATHARSILDIGTGSGLIALMLAQRTSPDVSIYGVEIDHESYLQAVDNVNASPWSKNIKLVHAEIQNFNAAFKFDFIVCNPPYFVNSFRPPDESRARARHANQLSFSDLIASVKRLLASDGNFGLILPCREGTEFITQAGRAGLFCTRKTWVVSKPSKLPERVLCEFSFASTNEIEDQLILNDGENWTETYMKLVSPYYPWAS